MSNDHETLRAADAQILQNESMRVHEEYRHYRTSGIALMVFLITLDGTIIFWIREVLSKSNFPHDFATNILFGMVIMGVVLSILSAIWSQYAQFLGYKSKARSSFAGLVGNTELQNRYGRSANHWFDQLDVFVGISVWCFIIAAILTTILFVTTTV